jgi:anti-sigma factor RsiW
MITDHPSFEQLSDFADGAVTPDVAAAVERHVAGCVACRVNLERLRAVLHRAAALPSTIEPPAEAWSALQVRLRRPAVSRSRPMVWRRWGLRAAAALLLVAGSSALTVVVLRGRAPSDVAAGRQHPGAPARPAAPAAVQAVERSYADVVDELTVTLSTQRKALSPATIATLERSLRVIDDAIREARAALAADPGNDALLDILSANYEQKVQLLRRASELPART